MYGAINLHQLEIFLSVTERRSFSKAAMGLHTSQPSVSMQIRNLEQALGVRLFDRLGHAVYLTREGELVLEYAKRIFSGISSLQSDLENLKEIKVGRLAVGASRVPSATTVPRAFALFKKQYPHTEIAVKTALSRQIEQWVLDDEIDLAIVAGDPVSRALVKEFYYEEQLIAVLPHRHPLAKRATVLPEHVIQETVLLPYTGRVTEFMEKAFAARGLAFKEQVILGSREAVKAALSVGYGISIMPKSAVDRSDKSGFLVTKNIRNLDLKFPINIVYHKDKHLSRLAAAFLEFLRKLPSLRSRP